MSLNWTQDMAAGHEAVPRSSPAGRAAEPKTHRPARLVASVGCWVRGGGAGSLPSKKGIDNTPYDLI
jgi:hypothetical protein